ncbi:MAG: hypothetical protein HY897_06125 [Deltaproteobacteria bacterium]|nr:hypothetical protein [Deltaproteobacteria bacterium]
MPAHVHGEKGGAGPSRFFRKRRRLGGAPEPADDDGGSRRHRTLVVSGSLALAGAAGVVLFVSAVVASRQVPFSVRLYAQGGGSGPALVRVTAYDSREGVQVTVGSVELSPTGSDRVAAAFDGSADAAAVARIPRGAPGSHTLMVRTAMGKRGTSVPALDSSRTDPRTWDVKSISAELRTGGALELGYGMQRDRREEYNTVALERLRVVPYPEQGRLASNLPNTIFVWVRDCPSRNISVGSAAGSGELRTDEAGMAAFEYVPTFGATGFDLGCGDWKGRAELRDRPQGIVASSPSLFAGARTEVALRVHTIMAGRPISMDVFRDCAWIDSRTVVPERGDAEVKYRLPSEPGLYTFEFYANVHAPGAEKARVPVLVPDADAALDLKAVIKRARGADREPIASALLAEIEKGGDPEGRRVRLLAAAFLSRLDLACGPPPLVFDSYDSDALFLSQEKAGVKKAAYTGIGVTWVVALVAAILIMVFRLKAAREAEEQISGHRRQIAVQHAVAAAIITITFALIVYVMGIWWRQ